MSKVPTTAMEYWEAVQFLIEDLLPEGTKFSDPKIHITYNEGGKE